MSITQLCYSALRRPVLQEELAKLQVFRILVAQLFPTKKFALPGDFVCFISAGNKMLSDHALGLVIVKIFQS
ncbi:MAG: hypothetical protein WA821_07735 [Anaerolineales bacterium]